MLFPVDAHGKISYQPRMIKKPRDASKKWQPPDTRQALYEILLARKKDRLGRAKLYGKLARDIILTGDLRLLK